ncbi:MAG TPA: hypothetical protein VJ825_08160 [Gemmatimonadaceae bacterium]|nr:hypothetical protein [Gemmatimonadaceae bacterium]
MRMKRWIAMIVLPAAIAALSPTAEAQGKGKGQGQGQKSGKVESKGRGAGQSAAKRPATSAKGPSASKSNGASNGVARGHSDHDVKGNAGRPTLPGSSNASPRANVASTHNRGRAVSRFARDLHVSEVRPVVRNYIISGKPSQHMTGGAVAYALARGTPENALLVVPAGNQVFLRNGRGQELLVLDDNRARTLGAWQVAPLDDRVKEGSPGFCRSGAGHPVWGRQWCLDKGFGLGANQDVRWGTTRTVSDIIFGRRPTTPTLARDALLGLLGPVAFDRLALHAVTLGYTDPLTGVWHSEATGPDVLMVNSGRYPIAELIDTNRDQRTDLMLVALRPW